MAEGEVDYTSIFDPDKPQPTLEELFANGGSKRRSETDDEEERQQERRRKKLGQPLAAAVPGNAAIEVEGSTVPEGAKGVLRDFYEAKLAHELEKLETSTKKSKKRTSSESTEPRRPIGAGLTNAERAKRYRERRRLEKESKDKMDLSLVAMATDALRSTSPVRRLANESKDAPPAERTRGPNIDDNQMIPEHFCTLRRWVAINDVRQVAEKQKQLEAAVKVWMDDRDNKAWKQALRGGMDGAFERNHPCRSAGLRDATQCESFADLSKLLEAGDYVGKIEAAFTRSIDLTSVWSGRVHAEKDSDEIIKAAKSLQPSPNDAVLYNFLRQDHRGHWRSKCEHIIFDTWDAPVEGLNLTEEHISNHYAHCTLKDVSQVLRNPSLVDAMTTPLSGPRVNGVLLGFDAVCREAVRGMPHDSQQWDKSSLQHDNRAWRRSPRWAPFFAALVARLCALPLPSLDDLGAPGAWWTGVHETREGPALRAMRHHVAHLTVARTIFDRLSDPKEGLWMASRQTMLAKELGCDNVTEQIEGVMRDWLYMRYSCLATVHMLTASWLAYVFSGYCVRWDYTPLSFTTRAVGSDGGHLARYMRNKRDRRDQGHGIDQHAHAGLVDGMAIGILMTQQHAEMVARGVGSDKIAAAMEQKHANLDLSGGQLATRMEPKLFQQCIWSDFRSDRSPYCVNDGITMEAVAIATFCRSYDRHRQPEKIRQCDYGPSGTLGSDPELHERDWLDLNQPILPPVRSYGNVLKRYVDACYIEKGKNHATRQRPWLMIQGAKTGETLASRAHHVSHNTATSVIARKCIDMFHTNYYLIDKNSTALSDYRHENFDEVMRTITTFQLEDNDRQQREQADEKKKEPAARLRVVIRNMTGPNIGTNFHAVKITKS